MVVCCFIAAVIAAVCGIALLKFRLTQKFEPYGLPPPSCCPKPPIPPLLILLLERVVITEFLSCWVFSAREQPVGAFPPSV